MLIYGIQPALANHYVIWRHFVPRADFMPLRQSGKQKYRLAAVLLFA
jgi:hypothetical protein